VIPCVRLVRACASRWLLLSACLVATPLVLAQKPIYLVPTLNFSTPGALASVRGDFNGDGQSDVAYVTSTTGSLQIDVTLTVLLNQGTNPPISVSAAPFSCLNSGGGSVSLAAADLNNDNHLDLILTCPTGYVVVLLGNGDGSFGPPVFQAVFTPGVLASPVDLNGDGFLDVVLIASNTAGSPSVAVLLNQGSANPGVLLAPKLYSSNLSGIFFPAIATGDFNGDGRQDIVVGGYTGNFTPAMSVFYGNGDGTLQAPQTESVGAIFTVADVNHDGIADIAYLAIDPQNIQPATLQVLLGTQDGKFSTGSSVALPTGESFSALSTAGTTHGGANVDLAVVGDVTTILLGDGNGGFTLGQSYGLGEQTLFVETDPDGTTNLSTGTADFPGHGDGTFRAPLAFFMGTPAGNTGLSPNFIFSDINGDGLTDIVFVDSNGIIKSALSRGDGTFSLTGEVGSASAEFLVAGDFDRDGKTDVVAILIGNGAGGPLLVQDSQVLFYKGNGDGTFQPASAPLDLHVIGASQAVVSDFNGDSIPDIVLSYNNTAFSSVASNSPLQGIGLVVLLGKGDGTFAAPIVLPQNADSAEPQLESFDLNNDGKPDIIFNGSVFYGNGDGTFTQLPLPPPGVPLALGDLNGDGIPDFVSSSAFVPNGGGVPSLVNSSVFAGLGHGAFQASPFYTPVLPANAPSSGASIADLNGDGNPDLFLDYHNEGGGLDYLSVSFGDGKGNFTPDNNLYLLGGTLARVNDRAPMPPNDNTPDYLASFTDSSGNVSVISFLNQLNPAPISLPPSPPPASPTQLTFTNLIANVAAADQDQQVTFTAQVIGSPVTGLTGKMTFTSGSTVLGTATVDSEASFTTSFTVPGTYTVVANYAGNANYSPSISGPVTITIVPETATLSASATSANENQPITFTAAVTGMNPTGSIAYMSGTTVLGMANLTNGTATAPVVFSTPGPTMVTANYSGDASNPPTVSNAISIAIATPDFTSSASPSSATVTAGQSATFTISVVPSGGYTGTLQLSCGTLPSKAACSFSSPTLSVTSGASATAQLTISTTAPTIARSDRPDTSLSALAGVGLLCFVLVPGCSRRGRRHLVLSVFFIVVGAGMFSTIAGCGAAQSSSGTPGTPAGPQTISITVADSAGKISHTLAVQLTVQ
jgi:hypothetical protein